MHEFEMNGDTAVKLWDFAGQDMFSVTHSLFLQRNSVILLVIDLGDSIEANHLEFWLEYVQSHAPKSKVLIIAAHSDTVRFSPDSIRAKSKEINLLFDKVTASIHSEEKIQLVECHEWRVSSRDDVIAENIPYWPLIDVEEGRLEKQLLSMTTVFTTRKEINTLSGPLVGAN